MNGIGSRSFSLLLLCASIHTLSVVYYVFVAAYLYVGGSIAIDFL